MPPYDQIHTDNLYYILLGGLLTVGLVGLAVLSRDLTFTWRRKSEEEYEADVHEFGGGVREGHRPVPLFLVIMLVLFITWAIIYTAHTGTNYMY